MARYYHHHHEHVATRPWPCCHVGARAGEAIHSRALPWRCLWLYSGAIPGATLALPWRYLWRPCAVYCDLFEVGTFELDRTLIEPDFPVALCDGTGPFVRPNRTLLLGNGYSFGACHYPDGGG